MEYNIAADVAVIGSHMWKSLGLPKLYPSDNVCGYDNTPIDVLGEFTASVQLGDQTSELPLVVSRN